MTTSRLLAGASGYSFKEWKGSFYPEKIKPEAMLAWYAERLPTVEINNTFYRMPKTAVLETWAGATPERFRFAIKASRRITHIARIKAETAAEPLGYLYRNLAALGAKRGPVLFQLPPNLKKDLPRLSEFLRLLPDGHGAAFEFRNDTWFADDVYDALKARRRGAVPVRARGQRAAAARRDRALGLRPAAPRDVLGRRSPAVGAHGSKRRRGARSTCTSCTSRRRRRTRRR